VIKAQKYGTKIIPIQDFISNMDEIITSTKQKEENKNETV
jgi:hypothetical protein